jgi:malonate-semialdehyde dehydrogenase (acetylating) / methylmalonate-semialdehyde dehydrogenase
MAVRLDNHIGGKWVASKATAVHEVMNPATAEVIAECPLGTRADLDDAVQAAREAFPAWRKLPPVDRVQYLFNLKFLFEEHAEELAAIVTRENGKTLSESRGSVRRGIQMIEMAIGAPSLLMGQVLEDVGTGIDCESIRQPMGVFACIAPFNFPAMVPLWFFPFAVACGNTFICKPSEQVPLSQQFVWGLIEKAGFPPGVLNLVHGGREIVEAMIMHPDIEGISFVGSSPIAEIVYREGAAQGKRVQALGGAKNFLTVMPDADREVTLDAISASAYGCAGERCLAGSTVVPVGAETHEWVREGLLKRVGEIVLGDGAKPGVTMGPVITQPHMDKVLGYIESGVAEGADLLVDGRNPDIDLPGYFIGPTLFDNVTPKMKIGSEEIFGPVMCIMPADSLEGALQLNHDQPLANATSIFTTSGKSARDFRYNVDASMAGINIGVAAPMAYFGFGGAKGSFFGDLKAHGREAFDFYTDRKVVITRW